MSSLPLPFPTFFLSLCTCVSPHVCTQMHTLLFSLWLRPLVKEWYKNKFLCSLKVEARTSFLLFIYLFMFCQLFIALLCLTILQFLRRHAMKLRVWYLICLQILVPQVHLNFQKILTFLT